MFAKFVGTLALVVAAFGQQASGQATVATASWAADDGSDNRDGGSMNDIGATINGGSNYVRFRTGGAPSFTTTLTLGSATSIAGVSVMVDESPDAEGEGYSDVESWAHNFTSMYGKVQGGTTVHRLQLSIKLLDGSQEAPEAREPSENDIPSVSKVEVNLPGKTKVVGSVDSLDSVADLETSMFGG